MKFKKNTFLTILFVAIFFSFIYNVNAEEPSAKCWYSINGEKELSQDNPILIYVEAKNGNVTSKIENYKFDTGYHAYNYASWSATLKNIPFDAMKSVDNSNKLACPVIYYKSKSTGTYKTDFKYSMSIYKEDLPGDKDRKEMKLYNQDIPESSSTGSSSTGFSCPYYDKKDKLTITINVSNDGNIFLPSGYEENVNNPIDKTAFSSKCPESLWIITGVYDEEDEVFLSKPSYCVNNAYTACYEVFSRQANLAPDGQYDENGNSTGIPDVDIPSGEPMTCESLKNTKTYQIIYQVFKWLQIAAPILLVIFGVLDFSKAVASGDNDAIKKAQKTFVKRIIIVVLILLLPLIMNVLFSLLDGAMGNNVSTCDIGK